MEEQLISFETAKLAKEKGFELNSICYFQLLQDGPLIYRLVLEDDEEGGYVNEDPENRIAVCTQSILQKWLREKHNIHIEIFLEEDAPYQSFYYRVMKLGQYFTLSYVDFKSESYEIVLEEALKEALNNIKDNS